MLGWNDDVAPAAPNAEPRVNAADKRIIDGRTDVNQLVTFKYKWTWDKYLAGCANHWTSQEIDMQRDESMFCNFGMNLINWIKLESPHWWAVEFHDEIKSLFLRAVELEYRYAEDTMPRGVLGLNAPMFKSHLRFIANHRAQQIGLDPMFVQEENPFPWMSGMIDLKKERNFFETRVIEYHDERFP